MPEIVDAGCPEDLITFVPSGVFLSLTRTPVPPEVHSAARMPTLLLVHTTPGTAGSALAVKALLAQPSSVIERMVDVPPASVGAELDLAGAIARADMLRLPVLLSANATGTDHVRVRPIDALGRRVSPDNADYGLVLPASHLVAERAAATAGPAGDPHRVKSDASRLGEFGGLQHESVVVKMSADLHAPAPAQKATEAKPPTATPTAALLRLRGGSSFMERVHGAVGSAFVTSQSDAPAGRSLDNASAVLSTEWSGPGQLLLDRLWQEHRQRRRRPDWQGQRLDRLRLWGRDPFGLRDLPPKPDFLPPSFNSFDAVPTNKLLDMFHRLDLTVADLPVNLRSLKREDGKVWRESDVTWMGPLADPAESDSSTLDEAEMPRIVHTFWYGSVLDDLHRTTSAFQQTISKSAQNAKNLGFATVLWTTVTREQFRFPDSSVANMRDWAKRNEIILINVHEVFNVATPMHLMDEFQLALSKGTSGGYAEGKDISLPEILHRFGGIGMDGDNVLHNTRGLRAAFSHYGFALEALSTLGGVGNSAMMSARWHPVTVKLIELLRKNYTLHVDQLSPSFHRIADNEADQSKFYAKDRSSRYRARSIMERSGPDNITLLLGPPTGHHFDSIPAIDTRHFKMGRAHTWLPEQHREPEVLGNVNNGAAQARVLPALQRAVTYLIRELANRKGDLHLLAVEPLIKDLPNPTAAWEAVVGFLLTSPDFPDRIRTATYSHFVNLNDRSGEAAKIERHTIELPQSVGKALGIPAQPHGLPGTHMWRGAFQVPVKLRYRPWLTIDFGEKHTTLDDISLRKLGQMVDSVAADQRRGFQVDVFIEGGGNGGFYGMSRGAEKVGLARATTVHRQLSDHFRNVPGQVVLHTPFSRGAGESAGPAVINASEQGRRRVAVWWSRRLPPLIDPVQVKVDPDGGLLEPAKSALRALASAVVESAADGALELQVAARTREQVRGVLKQLMPEVINNLPDHQRAKAVTVAELGPPATLPSDTVLIRARLQPLAPLSRADQDMVTEVNNRLSEHGIPQTPATILEVANKHRDTNLSNQVSKTVAYFRDAQHPIRLRGGAELGDRIRSVVSRPQPKTEVVGNDGEIGGLAPTTLIHSHADPSQAGVKVEALGEPSWPLRLTDAVTKHGHVYVISDNGEREQWPLRSDLIAAADHRHSVILLDAKAGRPPLASHLATLRYLLEQLAQRGLPQLPVVVTPAAADDVLVVTKEYGAVTVHQTLGKSQNNSTAHLAALWKATRTGQRASTGTSDELWPRITAGVLHAAAKLAEPTKIVTRIDDTFGALVWAADLTQARTAFDRLNTQWSPQQLTSGLTHVKQIIERAGEHPHLIALEPILELGVRGEANTFFDYANTPETDRPRALLSAVHRLEEANLPGASPDADPTTILGKMVTVVGGNADLTSVSQSLLAALDDIKAGKFNTAELFKTNNARKLHVNEKLLLADSVAELAAVMPDHHQQLELLVEGLLDCPPKSGPSN
ncbi:hypothetical protein [Micromonospora sp. NPDC049102]|uniref:hypothetical protein n=1 Tax=Micromonospora sp. NPDC049102 TaxID=3364265 RepID=UPI00371E2919